MWNFWKRKTWNNRKIAFVGILVATSVAFVLIFSTIAPIAAMPTFKVMIGGLPVKLTGYIFGPIIGMITGIISDLISFVLRPINIHYYYTLAFACDGIIPGIVGYLMNRRWKYPSVAQPPQDKVKYNNLNFFITLMALLITAGIIVLLTLIQPPSVFESGHSLVSNKYVFLGIVLGGSASLFLGLIIFRFIFSPKIFNGLLPLIVFSAFLELALSTLVALGDRATLGSGQDSDFITFVTAHFLLSPIKAWGNLIIIFFAYHVVSPLIYSKTSNGWESNEKTKITNDIDLSKIENEYQKETKILNARKKRN